MRRVDQIRLASYPRHAEAAVWAVAAAPALNTNHELLQQALAEKSQFQIPQDPLQQKIAILMATRADWQGSATELKLTLDLSDAPNQLSRKLKQVQEILQVQGIEISFPPRQEKGQLIRITTLNKAKEGWSSRSASRSAVDLPVGNVDCTLQTLTTVPTEIDRQIVSASENKEETITVPLQTDRQALMPADTGTAPPAESRGYVDCDGRADDVAQEWQQNAA